MPHIELSTPSIMPGLPQAVKGEPSGFQRRRLCPPSLCSPPFPRKS